MDLGKRISELRRCRDMTQRDLADVLGVSGGAVGMWETGSRQPDAETILWLADYFDVSVDYLFGREPCIRTACTTPALSDEDEELLEYYHALTRIDRRWLMGQAVDLVRQEEGRTAPAPKESLREAT